MEPHQIESLRWMRSLPLDIAFASGKIDVENGIIPDCVMCQEGEAKGHGVHLPAEFINDLVAYDVRVFGERGVKARLGHPSASDNTMGTQLGYFTNIRTRKKGGKMQAIGDLHLLKSADLSPEKPNMREWVLSMSQEAPDWIMSSIVFRPGRYFQLKKDGAKKYVWEYTTVKDEDGNESPQWVYSDPKLGNVYVEFGDKGEHFFTDLVENGAATDNMFSTEANPHLFVSQASSWLEENPAIKQFAQANPEKVLAFIKEMGITPTTPQPKKMSLRTLLFGNNAAEETTLSAAEVQELRDKLELADTTLAGVNKKLSEVTEEVTQLKASVTSKDTELAAAKTEITELKSKAAAVHTQGEKEDTGKQEEKSYHNSPANVKAREMQERRRPVA